MKKLTDYINESFDDDDNKVKTKIKGYHDNSTMVYYGKNSVHQKAHEVLGDGNAIGSLYHYAQASMIITVKTTKEMDLVLFSVRKDDPIYDVYKATSKNNDEVILRCGFSKKHLGAKTTYTLVKYKPKSGSIYFLDREHENDKSLKFETKQVLIKKFAFESEFFNALNKHIGY